MSSFIQVLFSRPAWQGRCGTDPGYRCETDTELDWSERANDAGYRCDWWEADWVRAAELAGLGPEETCLPENGP